MIALNKPGICKTCLVSKNCLLVFPVVVNVLLLSIVFEKTYIF